MMNPALDQFKKEIRHFSRVSVFNLTFAGIAIAFGVSYIVAAVFGMTLDPMMTRFPMLFGAVAMISFGLGISWLLTTARVFEGVVIIGRKLGSEGDAIMDERLTCLIVRMLADYRHNRDTIRTMILVSIVGGVCFLVLGISASLEFMRIIWTGAEFPLDAYLRIPSMLVIFGLALASLLSSYYFLNFAQTWDRRLSEIEESECTLQKTLGLDEQ
ncbi:MAG: hypothetical protein Q7T80_11005 [Methanoregula sp.]|nr:hypothetical protein [Methanoregula sp.]